MAAALVQSKTATGTTTASATWDSATTAGNILIAVYSYDADADPGLPTGWTLAKRSGVAGPPAKSTVIAYKENASSQSSTGNFSGAVAESCLVVAEFSGVATSSSLDKTASTSGSGTTASSGTTATTAQATELLICGYGDAAQVFSNPTASFSIIAQVGNVGIRNCMTYLVVSSTNGYSSDITLAGSVAWQGAIATFKEVASVGGLPTTRLTRMMMGNGHHEDLAAMRQMAYLLKAA